jgi:PAS domain S-box-containing protein
VLIDRSAGLLLQNPSAQRLADTARARRAERRYRMLLDAATLFAVLVLDRSRRIVEANTGAQQLLARPAAQLRGLAFSNDFCSGIGCEIDEVFAAADARGRFTGEAWCARGDGTRFWADIAITAVRGADGAVTDYIVVLRDASERKQQQDDQAQRALQNAAVAAFGHRAVTEADIEALTMAADRKSVV